jgi:hypothetical protein
VCAARPFAFGDIEDAGGGCVMSTDDQGVRSEYLEMPGLRLTPAQAARLWGLDRQTSQAVLDAFAGDGFLFRDRGGAYLRRSPA